MGCTNTKEVSSPPPPLSEPQPPQKQVDPRLPFTNYRQVFMMKNSWKAVLRASDDTAKGSLLGFFKNNPEFRAMFTKFQKFHNLYNEDEIYEDTVFEAHALAIFGVFNQVLENLENVDLAIEVLHKTGKQHAAMEGFEAKYFQCMVSSFMTACRQTLGDRFTPNVEKNFEELFVFIHKHLTEGFNSG
ncbi:cytoglobin-2-like isoform X2 [Tubulanus polymorphus]